MYVESNSLSIKNFITENLWIQIKNDIKIYIKFNKIVM